MKTRKLFWALVPVFALLAVSCNPDDKKGKEPDVPVDENKVIASIDCYDYDGSLEYVSVFKYDEKWRVVGITEEGEYSSLTSEITYSDDSVKIVENYGDYIEELLYALDASGRASNFSYITRVGSEYEEKIFDDVSFSYNGDGSLSSISVSFEDVVDMDGARLEMKHTWKDGNLIEIEALLMGIPFEIGERSYTDIPNDANIDLNSLIYVSNISNIADTSYDGDFLGIYGKRSDCMVETDAWDGDLFEYEYELDDKNRVSKINVYDLDPNPDLSRELYYSYKINYMK